MEAIVRALQASPDDETAPFIALLDDVHCIGVEAILLNLLDMVATAPARPTLAVAALGQPPAAYHHLLKRLPSLRLVDCWTDPHGWAKQRGDSGLPLFATGAQAGLATLQARLLNGLDAPTIVVLDSLSQLVDGFGAPAVCAALGALRRAASGLIACLHADLHPASEVDALCYGARCVAALGPAGEAPLPALQPHGRLAVRVRRRSGTVKAEVLEYRIESGGEVTFSKPLEREPAPGEATAAASGMATMRLDVSEAEAAARERVQLPYEHQGQGQLYAPGVDFREYLPEAAGGRRRGQGRLGHILYVRDSDSEEPDSDEDPDDDLDV